MKQGGNRTNASGFTIVETMIVLAVTGALLASAIVLISGRQNATQFQTAINDLQQQIQQVINQTSSGYYPGSAKFTCTVQVAAPLSISTTGATNTQGTNGACILIGNAVRFGGSDSPDTFTVYPLAANRLTPTKQEVQSLSQTWPTAVAPGTLAGTTDAPDDSLQYHLEGGLTLAGQSTGAGTAITASNGVAPLALITSFASYDNSSGTPTLNSGSQQLNLYNFPDWPAANAADNINRGPTKLISQDTVNLCFASGTTNQSGLITIGGNGSLSVGLQIKSGKVC